MKKPRRKPKKLETRGRPAIPPELRKVKLGCRVPARVKLGFEQRARAAGTTRGKPNSSVSAEVERAFEASEPREIWDA
jgi:hypothetical protein